MMLKSGAEKRGKLFRGKLFFPGGGFRPPGPPRLESLRSRNGVASLRDGKYFIFDGNPIGEYIMRGGLRPPLTTWRPPPCGDALCGHLLDFHQKHEVFFAM